MKSNLPHASCIDVGGGKYFKLGGAHFLVFGVLLSKQSMLLLGGLRASSRKFQKKAPEIKFGGILVSKQARKVT